MNYDERLSRAAVQMQESAIRKMGNIGGRVPDLISFAAGFPAPDLFAWDALREIAASLLSGSDAAVLQYGPTRGHRPFLETIVGILARRGIRASVDEVIVTTGSQQGLDLLARVLLDPGDVAVVELPTYTGAITAFRNVQARLVGVRQQDDGIDLDHLQFVIARERAAGRRVPFLYLTPNFQNPSGLLLSQSKRQTLVEWAAREEILILEDDPYGSLYFEDDASEYDTRPIRADDENGVVVYLSSFSKTLAPGLRVAWIAAPPPLAAKMEVAKQAMDLNTGTLDQRLVHEACLRGTIDDRLPMLRAAYQRKRDAMKSALVEAFGDALRWPEPRGGFFLWVTLPSECDADRMLARALEQKVLYVAGSAFYVEQPAANTLRLSFSAPTEERIREGVARLGRAFALCRA